MDRNFLNFIHKLGKSTGETAFCEAVVKGYRVLFESEEDKVEFGDRDEVVLYDSTAEIGADDVREFCASNDREVPEEGSNDWHEIENILREEDSEVFKDNCSSLDLGYCLVHGHAGRWNGTVDGGRLMDIYDISDLIKCVESCDDVKVVIEKGDGLVVYGYHHDGTNRYVVDQVTDAGIEFVNEHEYELGEQSQEMHEALQNGDGLLRKIDFWIF